MEFIKKQAVIDWLNSWSNPIQPNIVRSKIEELTAKKDEEEIDCPWCDGEGWIREDSEENEDAPPPLPCQTCDISGRITTAQVKKVWAEQERRRAAERTGNDDLPF